ncbi:MAG: DNA polymerase III subunit delta [Dehalococcoidales bacterium]|nr:DNA polymerase III subunit delta [Dehalococcoidales bacterium]
MLYILSGEDEFSVSLELERLKNSAGDPTMLSTNTSIFEGGQINFTELKIACETVPFLSDKRLVVVYGLLEKFAVKSGGARGSGKKTENQTASHEMYAELLNHLPDSTLLILIEHDVKENNPLFKLISSSATHKIFPALKAQDLHQWVNQRVSDEGGSINPNAVRLLARLIGSNLRVMSSEINKLVLYADGRRIEEDDINQLVAYTQEVSVFAMVDAIVEFNLQKAESLMQQLLKEGESPVGLLAMLNRQMRLIVRARELKGQKLPDMEIRSRLGIGHDFVLRKTLEQAQRYTLPRLRQVYDQLLEADIALKTSKYEGDLALNILVAELCYSDTKPVTAPKNLSKSRGESWRVK